MNGLGNPARGFPRTTPSPSLYSPRPAVLSSLTMPSWKRSKTMDEQAWRRFAGSRPQAHFLQSVAWAHLRAEAGWEPRRLLITAADASPDADGAAAVAGAQILVRRRPGGRLAYLPRGPICPPDHPAWPVLLDAMKAATRDCVALRIEPNWPDEPVARTVLEAAGLREVEALQPPSTLRLDLTQGPEALLAAMKQKWRYNIRLAGRKEVEVRREGAESLDLLESMIAETAQRNDFAARPQGYYRAVYLAFEAEDPESARLYVARFEDQPLACILVLHYGDTATYLYGGSRELERQRMPNHALQWRAIEEAIAAGLKRYDFWGIPDAIGRAAVAGIPPEEVPEGRDGLWGVWGFKRGFGGEIWRAAGAWDLVHAPLRYALASRWLPRLRQLAGRSRA